MASPPTPTKPVPISTSLRQIFSLREPSSLALREYTHHLQHASGLNMVSTAKLPDAVPRVNSRWEGLPTQRPRETRTAGAAAGLPKDAWKRNLRSMLGVCRKYDDAVPPSTPEHRSKDVIHAWNNQSRPADSKPPSSSSRTLTSTTSTGSPEPHPVVILAEMCSGYNQRRRARVVDDISAGGGRELELDRRVSDENTPAVYEVGRRQGWWRRMQGCL